MIGFGFTIYKFMQAFADQFRPGAARTVGIFLITLGTVSVIFGCIEYWQTAREIREAYHESMRRFPLVMAAIIGSVGGQEIPVILDFMLGYEQGAKDTNPDVTAIRQFADSWDDPAKGKELAKAQYSQGADIIFQIAAGTGQGADQGDGGDQAHQRHRHDFIRSAHVRRFRQKLHRHRHCLGRGRSTGGGPGRYGTNPGQPDRMAGRRAR